jgi:hypothetical protein
MNASSADLVYGTLDGFAKDEEGAPNTVGFYVDFDLFHRDACQGRVSEEEGYTLDQGRGACGFGGEAARLR